MRKIFLLFVIPAILAAPAPSRAGELTLTIQNGLVTLNADDVPLSMIMAEWARIGQTKIVNGDKMMTRVSLNLVDVPERRALDVLLRSASGFMAAERRTAVAGASVFDSIMILPTSVAPANTGPIASPPPQRFVPQPMPQPMPEPAEPDDVDPAVMPPGVGPQQPAPMMNAPTLPGQGPAPTMTLPRPGQLPAPQQPVPFTTRPGGTPPGGGPGGTPPGGGPGGTPPGGGPGGPGGGGTPVYEPDRVGG
jgi:hypothetical protein